MDLFAQFDTGVYCIRNKANGKRYIGSSASSLKKRWASHHRCELRQGEHRNGHLQRAWNRYGEKAFEFLVLEACAPEDCVSREQYWIDLHRAADREFGYNICPKAHSQLGFRHSDETKAKLAAANRARSKEIRERQAAAIRGRKHDPEVIARRAASIKESWASGKRKTCKHSQETKDRISAAKLGKKITEEHRLKIVAALKRRVRKPETIEKIVAANLARGAFQPKLTEAQVIEILEVYQPGSKSRGARALAKKFGVSRSVIGRVVRGRTWKHLRRKEQV